MTATVPMAENLPSGSAYRPADVLTMYGGKRVEVLNTDAEGRLILADAIVRACEDSPAFLIETSTLTGAQRVALGDRTAGVMGSDALRARVVAAGERVGEDMWPMPLPGYLRPSLDSKVADIANVSGDRSAGMLVAGVFLREFVADGVAVGTHRRGRPRVQQRAAVGLHAQGRDRGPAARHPCDAGGHRRRRLTGSRRGLRECQDGFKQ